MKKTLLAITFLVLFNSKTIYASNLPDCNENINRSIFSFNMAVDKYFLKPIAEVYNVLPVEVRSGINNALLNIESTISVPNQILQGNLGEAAVSISRFAINSTVGILGLFDPATALGIEKTNREDFGQTLAVWGMITAGDKTAFGENLGDTVYWATEGTDVVNFRSQNIKSSENLEKNSLDLYSAYKSLYLQRRENLVKNVKRSENQYGASEDEWKKIR
ncbi:MAG: VacJ family lipoprotein [Candidatus Fonsibacter ubiquis]|nr:VacJ family lipoprotein [Candidatus Fonsibacter ubiquis]